VPSSEPNTAGTIADFVRELVELREKAGLSDYELAARAKYNRDALIKAEGGTSLPSAELIAAYVRGCGGKDQDVGRWLARREKLSRGISTPAEPGRSSDPVPPRPARRHRRRLVLSAVGSVIVLGVVVVVAVIVIPMHVTSEPENKFSSALAKCGGPVQSTLGIASSADKDVLLRNAAMNYGARQVDGRCVQVEVRTWNSGDAARKLVAGWPDDDRPDVWSPASSIWLSLARERGGIALVPDAPTGQFVTTPLVIAMPRPMAEALGWPGNKEIGWTRLAALARDENGWASHNNSKWGRFWLGKTNPNLSTSGFNATVAAFFAQKHKINDLKPDDIEDLEAQKFVREIENSVAHYGETTLHFLANLRRADDHDRNPDGSCGPGHDHALSYISAVTIEESSMLAYNDGWQEGVQSGEKKSSPCTKLAAIYPKEGTLYSDHPYIELNSMDPAKKPISEDFLEYLRSGEAQTEFQKLGFRDWNATPGPLVVPDNGGLPDAAITSLGTPQGAVLDRVLSEWTTRLRKTANVLLVVDTSGSMRAPVAGGTRLGLVQKAVPGLLEGLADVDRVGLWEFSDTPIPLVDMGPLSSPFSGTSRRLALEDKIKKLTPRDGTALYDTVSAAVDTMSRKSDEIDAVVLLTDGKNEPKNDQKFDDLILKLQPNSDRAPVRVFTIAYGTDADEKLKGKSVLEQISDVTGATRYDSTDPQNIDRVLAAVLSNF
jgi:Ca-activated chloride channel family protein